MTTKRSEPVPLRGTYSFVLAGLTALAICLAAPLPAHTEDTNDCDQDYAKPDAVYALDPSLKEISGLAVGITGDLIAHDDELAKAWHLSAVDGTITKTFEFKQDGRSILGDFEGVARVNEAIWMINSRGFLFRASPEQDGVAVYNTGLERICEIEGLAWWSQKHSLLIACKRVFEKDMKGKVALYTWSLETRTLEPEPITLDLKVLRKTHDLKAFQPSGVAVRADGSEILILSSHPPAIAVLSAEGQLLRAHKLKKKHHPQPEGIALLADGTLVIADEGKNGPATLSIYRP